jgi:hypothetical protein
MKSMILALLPGLEEETGEFFDKVSSYTNGAYHKSEDILGSKPSRPPLWDCIDGILLSEYMVDNADDSFRPRNLSKLSCPSPSSFECK